MTNIFVEMQQYFALKNLDLRSTEMGNQYLYQKSVAEVHLLVKCVNGQ